MEVAGRQGNDPTRGRGTWRAAVAALLLGLCTAPALTAARWQAEASGGQRGKPPTILFMCPHGAAKSVLASAYFQRLAKERGLNVRVLSAGTDPDADVAPAVSKHLKDQGYEVPVAKPRRATDEDILAADVVVSIGCELKDLPSPQGRWSTGMTCRRRAKTLRALTKRSVHVSFSSWTSSFASK